MSFRVYDQISYGIFFYRFSPLYVIYLVKILNQMFIGSYLFKYWFVALCDSNTFCYQIQNFLVDCHILYFSLTNGKVKQFAVCYGVFRLDMNDFVRKNIFITLEILSLFAVKEGE